MRVFACVFAYVLLSTVGYAQESGRPVELGTKDESAIKVTLSGSFDLDWVYRGPIINEASFWQRSGAIASFGLNAGESATDFNDGQNLFNGSLLLNLNAELMDKISVVSSFGNLRAARNGTNPVTDNVNIGDPSASASNKILFYDLYAGLEELVDPNFSLKAGQISSYKIDFTGMGDSIFLDFSGAESPWVTREVLVAWPETRRDTVLPGGFVGTYKVGALDLDIALFPFVTAAGEGRSFNGNEGVYLATGNYVIDSNTSVGGVLGFMRGPSALDTIATVDAYDGGTIWVVGFGGSMDKIAGNIKAFGEVYWEFGDLAKTNTTSLEDIDLSSWAFQLGAKYSFASENNMWAGASFLYVSGAEDHSATNGDVSKKSNGTTNNDESKEFLSYENNNDFAIVEGQLFGLDIDSNYWAIKFRGGFDLSQKVDLVGKLGLFQLVEDVEVGSKKEDSLGTEIDINANYKINKSTSVEAGLAYLFGSDVLKRFTSDEDDVDYLLSLGTAIKF